MSLRYQAGRVPGEAAAQVAWTALFFLTAVVLGLGIGWGAASLSPFALLFAVAGVAGSIAVAFSPGLALIGLMAVLWLLPFGTLPFRVGFRFSFLDLVIAALLLVFAWQVCTHRQQIPIRPASIMVVLFAAMLVVAAGNGLRFGLTEDAITLSIKLASSVLLFLIVATWMRTDNTVQRAAKWFLVFAAAEAFVGVVLFFLPPAQTTDLLSRLGQVGYPVGSGVLRYITPPVLRATGTSIDPNLLGGALVFAIAFALALWAQHPKRWWALGMLGLFLLCLLLTRSRAALLGSCAAIVALTFLRYRALLWLYPLGGIAAVALPQTRAMIVHLISGLRAQDRAATMRLDEYAKSLQLIQDHPWLGVGFGPSPALNTFLGVSSIYLQLAEFGGLLTLGAFCLAVGAVLLSMWQRWRQGLAPEAEWVVLGAMAGLLGALVTGLFDHYYVSFPHTAALFWLVAGIGVAAAWAQRSPKGAADVRT